MVGVLKARVGGSWVPIAASGLLVPGGTAGQVLVKQSAIDGDAAWQGGVWTDFVPTLAAGVAVAKTVTHARYSRIGKIVHVTVNLAVTGVGTAGNRVEVGLPVPAAAAGGNPIFGTFAYLKVGVGYYHGAAICIGTAVCGQAHGLGAFIGQAPAFTTQNGDVALYSITYEAA